MNLRLLFQLTLKSMLNRKFTAFLSLFSICISVFLLLSVETIRTETRNNFTNTVSGTDLIVGARSGSVQLLLYSVFHIGNATNNIGWESYQEISSHKQVAWAIPISLGDSHKSYRVMGTTTDFFTHFKYANEQAITFKKGQAFDGVYETVIGSEVAKSLGYKLGQEITLSHGLQDTHFAKHDDKPFTIVGIISPTGTPIDKTILVSLEGIEALHSDWQSGVRSRNAISAEDALKLDLQPKQITAFMLGLKSKLAVIKLQRAINNYKAEPLLAILPGIALSELWQLIGAAETGLWVISIFVVFNSFIGLLTVVLTSLNERRREMAILRSLGSRPSQIFILLGLESFTFGLLGSLLGICLYYLGILLLQPILADSFGLYIPLSLLSDYCLLIIASIILTSALIGIVPGYRAYRLSLSDGMSIKL